MIFQFFSALKHVSNLLHKKIVIIILQLSTTRICQSDIRPFSLRIHHLHVRNIKNNIPVQKAPIMMIMIPQRMIIDRVGTGMV